MKRILSIVIAAVLAANFVFGAEDSNDSQKKIKTGFNIGPLPAISYSTERGLQLGALADMYFYGDGKIFPKYYHKFNVEVSYYTKGSMNLHMFYDSQFLIPGIRFSTAVSYIPDTMNDFYGFNGDMAVFDSELGKFKETYHIRKNMFRAIVDFQGPIGSDDSRLKWVAGLNFFNYRIEDCKGADNALADANSVYRKYVNAGIIPENQKNGGNMLDIKAGLVFDTRDHEAAPNKGVCAELILIGSFIGKNNPGYLNVMAHWRQYISLVKNRLVFAYRLAYQGNLAGETPWYALNNVYTSYFRQVRTDGIGSQNTIRGMYRNRLTALGVAWANFEFRVRLFDFRLIKQYWYVAANAFFDMGYITQTYHKDQMLSAAALGTYPLIADTEQKLHYSTGAGLKLCMNYNFIISFELAKALREQDGGKLNSIIQINYIF